MTKTEKTEKTREPEGAGVTRNPSPARAPQQNQQMQRTAESRVTPFALEASRAFNPFWLMRRLFEGLGRWSGIGLPAERAPRETGAVFVPDVEISRRGDKLVAQVDLPGLAIDDIAVTVDNGMLVIEGERRSEHDQYEGDVWSCERTYGRFQRTVPLPENADIDSAEARFEDGVLEVSIRAPEEKLQGKRIEVRSGAQPEPAAQPAPR